MSQDKVAEAWKNYPLKTKLKGSVYTLRPMAMDDGDRLQAFARELPPHDLLFMRRDITKPEGIARWMDAVKRGEDPKSVIRDPAKAARIQFPIDGIEVFRDGAVNEDHPLRRRFTFLAGQPADVTRAYDEAMGFTDE